MAVPVLHASGPETSPVGLSLRSGTSEQIVAELAGFPGYESSLSVAGSATVLEPA